MFDPNTIPYPLCPELAPLECAYLIDKLYSDLTQLDNCAHEITVSANCFDALPRSWQFTPISEMDEQVFGPAVGHKITVNVSDMYGFTTVAQNTNFVCPTSTDTSWNDDVALLALAEAIATTWAQAAAGYMKYMFDKVGFDSEMFLTVTNDNVSVSEQFKVLMGWGAIHEMLVILDDLTTAGLMGDDMYSDMRTAYDQARTAMQKATDVLVAKATTNALETFFNKEEEK